jgi:hypothetical protein
MFEDILTLICVGERAADWYSASHCLPKTQQHPATNGAQDQTQQDGKGIALESRHGPFIAAYACSFNSWVEERSLGTSTIIW